ncbi:cytochrome c1 [Paraferrimonas sp. SM1919]|uniref:cytochrome c1 n=1 Tax=Paraferrimonas sp. SM1919 TaxID=2662263 RepID=UPI0013D31813|nr:cytochrome c1 [Paraferrimonas sp. SM1919]
MKKLLIGLLTLVPSLAMAAGGAPVPYQANIDLTDTESLQRGAKVFMESCFGCHSAQYQRYNRVADDLNISYSDMLQNYMVNDAKIGELMVNSVDNEQAAKWFGAAPPDLTLVARVRGEDWVYSYLKTFYADETRPFGVNNTVFPSVGMPHVLQQYQGIATVDSVDEMGRVTLKTDENGNVITTGGSMNAQEYDQLVKDLTGFLVYSADPVKLERESLGKWVLGFLFIFFIISYLLKKEYWKDVH